MNNQERSGMGITSLGFSLVAILLWCFPFFIVSAGAEIVGGRMPIWWFLLIMLLCVLGIICGSVAYFGEEKDPLGLGGFILSIIFLSSTIFNYDY